MRHDLSPEILVTHECFVLYCGNLKISSSSQIGRKTVGPISCRVGVGDVNFPRTRLLCGGCPPLGWDGWKRLVRRI